MVKNVKSRFKKLQRSISSVMVWVMFVGMIPMIFPGHSYASDVTLKLNRSHDIDVVLAVGNASMYISTFEADLKAKLAAMGIPADRIKISAVQATSVSSETSSAADIVNGWEAKPIGTSTSVATKNTDYSNRYEVDHVNNRIVSQASGRPAAVYYNPNGFNTRNAIIEYQWGIVEHGAGSFAHGEAGFIFRMDESRDRFYTYTLDNHAACGNLMGFGVDGIPAEAILKFTNGSDNPWSKNPLPAQTAGTDMYSANLEANPAAMKLNDFQPYAEGRVEFVKIELDGNNIKIYRKQNPENPAANPTEKDPYKLIFDWTDESGDPLYAGTYGFYVWDQSGAYFSDIKITTESTRNFAEIIREPEWRDSAKRYIVNLEDKEVGDFDNDSALGEILTRLGNEEIHYIGWGTDENEGQTESFIDKNNGNGTFINRDSADYDAGIEQMADYIATDYASSVQKDVQYVPIGNPIDFEVTPSSMANNTDGKWRIAHDPTVYENHNGVSPFHNQYVDSISDISFNWVGKYDIYFDDELVKTIYIHDHSISKFDHELGPDRNVTLTDRSYDPDHESGHNKGISDQEWRWKETSDTEWTYGDHLPQLDPGKEYIIEQRVKDEQGEWSRPYGRYVSTTNDNAIAPIAEFSITPGILYLPHSSILKIDDSSYDPTGQDIVNREWKVTKNGVIVGMVIDSIVDFNAYGPGEYKLSLKVTDATGNDSNWFTRKVVVIDDSTLPSAVVNQEDGGVILPNQITLRFSDDEGGDSGIVYQQFALTRSTTVTEEDWSNISANQVRHVTLSEPGTWYIHYKTVDFAGNFLTGYYGPYEAFFTTLSKSGPTGQSLSFSVADFVYSKNDEFLEQILITALPDHGKLIYEGNALSVTDVVYKENLDQIVFEPQAGWHGITSFKWIGHNGTDLSPVEIETVLIINTTPEVVSSSISPNDFAFNDLDGDSLTKIKITSLPDHGTLKLDGVEMTVNQEISSVELDKITFEPDEGWTGSTRFKWLGYDGLSYSATEAEMKIDIRKPSHNAIAPTPVVEEITVDVETGERGAGSTVSKATIIRTTLPNGRVHDEVSYSQASAMETVENAQQTGQTTARIVIPDDKDEVSELHVNLPHAALATLSAASLDLEIYTNNARIVIPNSSLRGLDGDVYFRVVPIREENETQQIVQRAKTQQMVIEIAGDRSIEVVGRPMTIETNLTSRAVDIILPLAEMDLPDSEEERNALLADIVIFIEHSDGEKVLVKPEVVPYEGVNGGLGLKFGITKFSTFTILNMEGWEEYLKEQEAKQHHLSYILGYPDGTFKPNRSITRAEMATLLDRIGAKGDHSASEIDYSDITTKHWAYDMIATARSTGWMEGYPDGTFKPESSITRAEMASIVSRWLQLSGDAKSDFSDTQGHWAENAIALVQEAGMMNGMPDGSFKPDQSLSRAEAVATINRILKREPLHSKNPSWLDVTGSHWAYAEIEEASQDHEISKHRE